MKEKHNYPYHVTQGFFVLKVCSTYWNLSEITSLRHIASFLFSSAKKELCGLYKFANLLIRENKRLFGKEQETILWPKIYTPQPTKICIIKEKYQISPKRFLSIWLFVERLNLLALFFCLIFFMEIITAVVSHLLTLTSCCRCRYIVVCVMVSFHD